MTAASQTNPVSGGPGLDPALDPAQQSLAEALRVSFGILKVAMLALLVAYAFSGTFSVGSNEVALRLRFGDYVGAPGERVLERGTYLAAPFPLEQVIKVDTRSTASFGTRPDRTTAAAPATRSGTPGPDRSTRSATAPFSPAT
jgi:hypothetical protein